jgi:glycosyltransferase EpsD
MKILVVASNMVHIKNFHLPYIEAFSNDGHNVYVMASGQGADFEIPFKKRSLSLKNLILSRKIKKIIKRESFDIIYVHTTLAAFWVRFALKGVKNRPIVVNTVHGYLFGDGFGKLHNKLYLMCEKILKKQTDHIVVMNQEDEEIARKNNLCLGKIYKIDGMGVDFNKKKIEVSSPSVPPKKLIYVGEISKRKNQMLLVKALRRLPYKTLTLVGDGKERKSIEKYIKKHHMEERVHITGFTKNVGEYLKNADLYVSASRVEGLPFNIIEALASGLNIVASDIKGQRDILPREALYSLENEDDFIALVNNPPLYQIDAGIYSLDRVFDVNMRLYYECAEGAHILKKELSNRA